MLWVSIPDTGTWDPLSLAGVSEFRGHSQTFQNPLIKEYTLNHIRDPIIISGIFLN